MADENTPTPPATPPANPVLNLPDELVPEAWKDHVRDLRREHKKLREQIEQGESQSEAKLTKLREDLTKDAEGKLHAANTAAEQRLLRAELKAAALKAGMVDLDGLKLADLSKVKLTESGDVDGADALMAAMKEAKPWLFGANSTSTPGNPPPSTPPTGKRATEMTAEEYARAEADFLSRNR